MRITDAIGKGVVYCGNKTGQNLHVTGDEVKIIFHSDGEIERRGYLLNFTLVSLPSVSSGKRDNIIKKLIRDFQYAETLTLLRPFDALSHKLTDTL